MQNINTIFGGGSPYLDEVIILPVGSYGTGTYNLPAGDTWLDYESVEVCTVTPSEGTGIRENTSLVKELLRTAPTSWTYRAILDTSATNYRVSLRALSASTFEVYEIQGGATLQFIKAYKKKYGTRNHSKVINVNGGANIAINSRYEIDIASALGAEYLDRDLIVTAEIYNNSGTGVAGWGEAGWVHTSNGCGVKASVLGERIIVQTGAIAISAISNGTGNPFGNVSSIVSAPCRVKVWKVEEYLPATKSSGGIVTIWENLAGVSTGTIDWSGTGKILSQFDAIMTLCGTTSKEATHYTTHTPSSLLLFPKPLIYSLGADQFALYNRQVTNVTETSFLLGVGQGVLFKIVGINYN